MYLDPGAGLGGHTLAVRGVYARPGQAEAARHLGVAVLGRQVERVLALSVGDVHVAPEGTKCLSQTQLAVPGADVDGGLPLAVQEVEVRSGMKEEQSDMAVVPPEGEMEWS